jgi:hypothetical protein
MASDRPPTLDPKIAIDVGRGLAAILITLSGIGLTLSKSLPPNTDKRVLIVVQSVSLISLLISARIIDWLLDRIDYEVWVRVLRLADQEKEVFRRKFECFDGAMFRSQVYGGGYLFFTLVISVTGAVTLWSLLGQTPLSNHEGVNPTLSIVLAVYLSYQMLTIKSKFGNSFLVVAISTVVLLLILRVVSVQ